jgi:hypothetical protein
LSGDGSFLVNISTVLESTNQGNFENMRFSVPSDPVRLTGSFLDFLHNQSLTEMLGSSKTQQEMDLQWKMWFNET